MAEQDFIISIRTTADTAGIKQTEAELQRLGVQVESIKSAAASGGGGIAGQLGSVLGLSAVGAGLAVNRAIKAYGEEQVRIATELDHQLTTLIESAKKWDEMARSASSMEDVVKVAESATKTMSDAQREFLKFQNAGLQGWQEWIDALTTIPGITSGVFDKMFRDQASRLSENVQRIREARQHAVEDAKATTDAFDEEKLKPFDEAFKDINDKLQEQERLQQEVGTSNIESYIQIGKQIETYKAQLKELINLENQRKREAEETRRSKEADREFEERQQTRAAGKFEELSGGLPPASNAAGYLRNMDAAERARREGDTKTADLLEKTAQQLKESSAGPSRRAIEELERLKRESGPKLELSETNQILRDIREAWR